MLPYKNRLVKKTDFEKVYKYGNFFYSENIGLKIKRNNIGIVRVGFSVGTKFSKRATKRNKTKRQLREIFHKMLKEIQKGVDIIVTVKKEKNTTNNQEEMENSVKKLLLRIGLISNK